MPIVMRFLESESAATTVEYAVVLTLIAGACIFVILAVGTAAAGMWGESATDLGNSLVAASVKSN